MISNAAMKPNRYGRWAKSRNLVNHITTTLAAGGVVVMATYTRATEYDNRHVGMFKADQSGAYVKRGKGWVCIDGCDFRFYCPK